MKKATRVEYNPYTNRIGFWISQSTEGPWESLSDQSTLLQYTDKEVLFSNCVSDIAETINRVQNTVPEGLEIQFIGPLSDFALLQKVVRRAYNRGTSPGPLTCRHIGVYESADVVIERIKEGYSRISSEFSEYLPGGLRYVDGCEAIGDTIVRFEETISDAIPVCVIGNYSVGKSALINSLIGEEVLPSKENPSTAKNAEVVRSDRYSIAIDYDDGDRAKSVRMRVSQGALVPVETDSLSSEVCAELCRRAEVTGKSEVQIVHDVLDCLNESKCNGDGFLDAIGWNVVIELPFGDSLLSGADNKIVFFDTPGSDNDELNHEEHDRALADLMGSQTNALPILVTSRDQLVRRDTAEIRETLDHYADNFASPCCIVVLTKCDLLNRSKLEEGVPAGIKNWHGKSIILFTTPIGALGSKKGESTLWFDDSYRSDYEVWLDRQRGPKRVSLPEYNIYPCEERESLSDSGFADGLYETGIPSLEYEILYYIQHFGRYKKCVRGRKDLTEALDSVRLILDEQKREAAEAKEAAENKRAAERLRLINELEEICLPGIDGVADSLLPTFTGDLDAYCSALPDAMGAIYDELAPDNPLEMDAQLNKRIREHCQRSLIDECYQRKSGARDAIKSALVLQASQYAEALQAFVADNDSHFSEFGSKALHDYLDRELELPKFDEVESVLANIAELFEKAALVKHQILRLAKNPKRARTDWIEAKKNSFEYKLRGGIGFLRAPTRGLFVKTLLDDPIESYYKQLERWAEKYKVYIRGQLDSDNAILSGMEAEIERLDGKVADLESRLLETRDVSEMLESVLDAEAVEAFDE